MNFYDGDGAHQRSAPYTMVGLPHDPILRNRGDRATISVAEFFMRDDTARVDGTVREIDFADGSKWPPLPDKPPPRNGTDAVAVRLIGLSGTGAAAKPVVACFNYGDRAVHWVYLLVEYLDEGGKTIDQTRFINGSDEGIMDPGAGRVVTGGDPPPEGSAGARVLVRELKLADESKWTAPE